MLHEYTDRYGAIWQMPHTSKSHDRYGIFAVFKFKDHVLMTWPDYAPDIMDLPGGKIDDGETEHQGLIREVKEETGFNLPNFPITKTYSQFFKFYAEDLIGDDVYCDYHQKFCLYDLNTEYNQLYFEGKKESPDNGFLQWVKVTDIITLPINVAHKLALTALLNICTGK